jgi:pseudaminic acid biosynthesis-associated methylase
MEKVTKQMNEWDGQFGKEYTDRNDITLEEMDLLYQRNYGVARTAMNAEFVGDIDRSARILEVGSNVGNQLLFLQKAGFKQLYGIELQSYAVELSKRRTSGINIIEGSALDIPFKDRFFDLVFTSGVLIHISPADINTALDEILRCTKRYVWGFEYYADTYTSVPYRGRTDLLWKTDFAKLYLDRFPGLKRVSEKHFKYLQDNNVDTMFLLQR